MIQEIETESARQAYTANDTAVNVLHTYTNIFIYEEN